MLVRVHGIDAEGKRTTALGGQVDWAILQEILGDPVEILKKTIFESHLKPLMTDNDRRMVEKAHRIRRCLVTVTNVGRV